MKNKCPAYRVTVPMTGLDNHLESWFQHFVELGDPVAIVEKSTGQNFFSVWVIREEVVAESGSNNREGNLEMLDGYSIVREANLFKVRLQEEQIKLDKQREELSNGKEEREESDHHTRGVGDQEPQGDIDGGEDSDLLEKACESK